MAAPVSIRGLSRCFAGNDRPAVDKLDLEVNQGEVVCLVGPSGCGKSTTLRLVAGLDTPDDGEITIDGRTMRGVPPQDRDVAMVFQGFALYPHMTVRQILGFPLKMRGAARAERERAIAQAADMLAIRHLLDRRPGQLSGGEQQRVAMGRALVRQPKVFLFDEPLSNLDAALRAELRIELGRLLRRLEATALYVTHDQAEAMTLGKRIAVLRQGRLEQLDTPRCIYEAPQTSFVASFFGVPPMNLVPVERSGEHVRFGPLRVPVPRAAGAHELLLGIRPEHVQIQPDGAPSCADDTRSASRLPAQIVSIEPHGAETHVELEANGQLLRARVKGFDAPVPGESVSALLDLAHVRWFDASTGHAL
ncbi:MAG: ABC transporter ATP-binding protein [Polyangiaceae bacterium]|nr:ABC transporter ATP-binding protein [Polyangiaceae bacterium]